MDGPSEGHVTNVIDRQTDAIEEIMLPPVDFLYEVMLVRQKDSYQRGMATCDDNNRI